jgi:hypothetical protein
MITKEKISTKLNNNNYQLTKQAKEVLFYMLEEFEGDTLEIFHHLILEASYGWFIYYYDAAQYLIDAQIYDYEQAVTMGYKPNVMEFAEYYLRKEVLKFLKVLEKEFESEI